MAGDSVVFIHRFLKVSPPVPFRQAPGPALPALPALLLSLAVSAAIYLPMTLLLRSEAIRAIMQFGKKKLRRAAKPKD
jgi:hypothetical protein